MHFLTYVKDSQGTMWEMDGRRKGPVERGVLGPDEDVLSPRALQLGPRAIMRLQGEEELRFSLLALAPSLE